MKTLQDIVEYIKIVHAGQVDKTGAEYWLHPYTVSKYAADICDSFGIIDSKFSIIKCALLHDVLEDCNISIEQLKKDCELSDIEISSLLLLTHDAKTSYDDYVKSISASLTASVVKVADLKHNMDVSRFAGIRELTDKDLKRLNKYLRHYDYLMKTIKSTI